MGGTGATVVVTMTLDSLLGGLAEAVLDNGDRISAATARRLACESGIVPVVLGGRSEVLDLGRRRRYHSKAQRIPSPPATTTAPLRGVTPPPPAATSTTTTRGLSVVTPASARGGCSARGTTAPCTTRRAAYDFEREGQPTAQTTSTTLESRLSAPARPLLTAPRP